MAQRLAPLAGSCNALGAFIYSVAAGTYRARRGERLARMVKAPLDKAEAGDMHAFREICDRLEGKPAQRLEVTPVAEDATAMPSYEVARRIAWILRARPAAKGLLPERRGNGEDKD
jgi:hypothetical protein